MALRNPRPSQQPFPPLVPWRVWFPRFVRGWKQGDHILDVGPTQSGKSLLAKMLVTGDERHGVAGRRYVVVFGTKSKDPTLDGYIADGFTRIDHWPPVRRDFRDQEPGHARFILWPKIQTIDDLKKHRDLYAKCLDQIYVDGRWTVVIDETLWFSSRDGLDLGGKLGTMAYGSASNKVSMLFLMQRPAGVPRILWQSCTTALVFHLGVTNDVRELASLGTVPPRDAVDAIRSLQGHDFLDLPCRGNSSWAISRVQL